MTSLFDVGRSALNSYRQSLAVTGQNIANINTEGYKRREAALEEVVGSQGGVTSLANQTGLGVRVGDIKRSFDQYLLDRARTASAQFEKLDSYVEHSRQLEDMLLPNEGDLGAQIASFFDALREVSASPADIAPRAVAVEQGKSLAAGFNTYAMQLDQMKGHIQNTLQDRVNELNLLAQSLADINTRISASGQSGNSPNSILDLRDQTLTEISKLTDVTVNYTGRGIVEVKLGSSGAGPILVTNNNVFTVGLAQTNGGLQPTIQSGGQQVGTNQIAAGNIAGLVDAFNTAQNALDDVNHLAQMMSTEMNAQHRQGITLDGEQGINMFSVSGLTVAAGTANRSDVAATVNVLDPEKLPLSKMTATYIAEEEHWLLNGEALENPIRGVGQITAPGFTLTINGTPQAGDTLHLDPLSGAAAGMRFLLDKPQQIAASSGMLVTAHPDNLSDTEIDVDAIQPPEEVDLRQLGDIFTPSSSPIEASEFIRDGFVAEIPAGSNGISLSALTKQSEAKFYLSALEISKISQLQFSLEDTMPTGPFTFNVGYMNAFPNAAAGSNWSDLGELAEMLNQGVITDSAGFSLQDRGLFASGSGGTLTLATSRGNFDDSDANIARLSVGGGTVRATVTDAVSASDIQIFTKEGRHIAGNVLNNEEIALLMREENGFVPQARYKGDTLNQTDPAYRGMDIDLKRSDGSHELVVGANARVATAIGGRGDMPISDATAQAVTVGLQNGLSAVVNLERGGSAVDAADAFNRSLNSIGVHATARLRVELSDLQADGAVSFMLEGENPSPIKISANVVTTDLTNLATAINDQSARLGITAQLSSNKQRLILESSSGRDIFISEYNQASPILTSRVIHDDGQAASNDIELGGESGAFDHARYSGIVTLDSVKSFTMTRSDESVISSTQNVANDGLVQINSNASSDSKLISFAVNSEADANEASDDGHKAIAAGGRYQMSLPTATSGISFTATVDTSDLAEITPAAVHEAMISELRSTGPLSSMSAGDLAAKPASQTFRYTGSGIIDPATDSFSVVVENTTFNIPLTGVTNAISMLRAAATEINNANLGVIATAVTDSTTTPATHELRIEADGIGEDFSMGAVSFTDASDSAATVAFNRSETAKNMPKEGDHVYIDYANQSYRLEMKDGEIVVTGGEPGRITAYLDADNRLQIFGGGSLSGQPITVSSSEKFAQNDTRAGIFGLTSNRMRFAGQPVTPVANMPDLTLSVNDVDVTVSVSAAGTVTTDPVNLPAGLAVEFEMETGASEGRLVLTYDGDTNSLNFDMPQNNLGIKVADIDLSLTPDGIKATSRSGDVLDVEVSASSLTKQQVTFNDLVVEDLLVFVTGQGARQLNADYREVTQADTDMLASRLSEKGLIVKSVSDDGMHYDILDGETGDVIANRVLSDDRKVSYENYSFTIKGDTAEGDQFTVEQVAGAVGDARNLNAMIKKQSEDLNGTSSGGFSNMFATLVAGVGASVSSSTLARDGAEATKEAALEAEAQFSGVNLDSEAAALIEFQQAYQASARILSTARELFQTLMDVV